MAKKKITTKKATKKKAKTSKKTSINNSGKCKSSTKGASKSDQKKTNPLLDGIICSTLKTVDSIRSSQESSHPDEADSSSGSLPEDESSNVPHDKRESPALPSPSPPVTLSNHKLDIPENKAFIDFMSYVSGIPLDSSETNIVASGFREMQESTMNVARKCNPESCDIINICPFTKIKKYPKDQLCPVDKSIVDYAFKEYEQYLRDETGNIDGELSIIERNTIVELIECDIEEFRARGYSNEKGLVISQAMFVIKDTGEVVYNDVENPVYNLRDRISRRKSKLLQRLLLTPEARARFNIDTSKRKTKNTKKIIEIAEEKIRQYHAGLKSGQLQSDTKQSE